MTETSSDGGINKITVSSGDVNPIIAAWGPSREDVLIRQTTERWHSLRLRRAERLDLLSMPSEHPHFLQFMTVPFQHYVGKPLGINPRYLIEHDMRVYEKLIANGAAPKEAAKKFIPPKTPLSPDKEYAQTAADNFTIWLISSNSSEHHQTAIDKILGETPKVVAKLKDMSAPPETINHFLLSVQVELSHSVNSSAKDKTRIGEITELFKKYNQNFKLQKEKESGTITIGLVKHKAPKPSSSAKQVAPQTSNQSLSGSSASI